MTERTRDEMPFELTDVEWTIMKVIWANEPCAAGTVQELLAQDKGWAYSTIKTTMDRMVQKGLLSITKIRNVQLFSSTVSRTQASKGEFQKMLKRAFDGALGPMVQYMLENEKLTRKDLDALRDVVGKTDQREQKGKAK
jgi:BlaI family transcriptional regulator, penicillinase repressor